MNLVRRAFFIFRSQDKRAGEIARALKADKSEVVQLALEVGLNRVENAPIGEVMNSLVEQRLKAMGKESIKGTSAKRRAK